MGMNDKVILIPPVGKMTLRDMGDFKDNVAFKEVLDLHQTLTAMEPKYKLGMFVLGNKGEYNSTATEWMRILKHGRYENVYGDAIVYEDDGDVTMDMIKEIWKFVVARQ